MTFEEVHDKIFSGGKASSLSEAKESGEILTNYGGKSQQMFAVVLAESKKMFIENEEKWASWAVAEFHLKSRNSAQHIRQIGDVLCALREEDFKLFQRFLSTSMSKLYELYEIYLNKGLPALINFVTLYFPNDDIEREELRRRKALLLDKKKPAGPEHPDLGLKFDVAGDTLDEEDLRRRTAAASFNEESALTMGTNGVLLCHTAVRYVVENHARIEQEAQGQARLIYLTWLRDQEQKMREAADALRALAERTTAGIQED